MTELSGWFALLLMVAVVILLLPWLRAKEAFSKKSQRVLMASVVFLPVASFSIYLYLGTPQFAEMSTMKPPAAQVTLVDKLAAKLEKNPKDIQGWILLGRSYMTTEDYHKAVAAFEKAYELDPKRLSVLISLADALAITNAGNLQGRPYKILQQAYAINQENTTTLWLLGIAERQKGKKVQAAKYWLKLYYLLPDDHPDKKVIRQYFTAMNIPLLEKSTP